MPPTTLIFCGCQLSARISRYVYERSSRYMILIFSLYFLCITASLVFGVYITLWWFPCFNKAIRVGDFWGSRSVWSEILWLQGVWRAAAGLDQILYRNELSGTRCMWNVVRVCACQWKDDRCLECCFSNFALPTSPFCASAGCAYIGAQVTVMNACFFFFTFSLQGEVPVVHKCRGVE